MSWQIKKIWKIQMKSITNNIYINRDNFTTEYLSKISIHISNSLKLEKETHSQKMNR